MTVMTSNLRLCKAPHFLTTIGMTKGYHQLVLHPDSNPITAFSFLEGLFQRKVLPLELLTASAVFSKSATRTTGICSCGVVSLY